MLSLAVYKGGALVDKNRHVIGTKMPIFHTFVNSSQHLKFDPGQNATVVSKQLHGNVSNTLG